MVLIQLHTLRTRLKQLCLYWQSKKATVIGCVCRFLTAHQDTKGYSVPCNDTQTHADDDKGKIMALKSENGKTLGKFLASLENDNYYHNALIV